MVECISPIQGRRRVFWTTQIDACGDYSLCLSSCGTSGLMSYVPEGQQGRTFKTNNYVVGLALNILLTDARKEDRNCGYRPNAVRGHWSDSFRSDGLRCGTNLRDIPTQYRVSDTTKLIESYVRVSMQKLVSYGVAQSTSVEVKYVGGNIFELKIEIVGTDGERSRVAVSGQRASNAWVWSAD